MINDQTIYVLLGVIIVIQLIILVILLKPYIKTGFDRMNDNKLYDEVVKVVQKEGRASTSFLQRKFGLGYARSARIMDKLEDEGIVGKSEGSAPREVLTESE